MPPLHCPDLSSLAWRETVLWEEESYCGVKSLMCKLIWEKKLFRSLNLTSSTRTLNSVMWPGQTNSIVNQIKMRPSSLIYLFDIPLYFCNFQVFIFIFFGWNLKVKQHWPSSEGSGFKLRPFCVCWLPFPPIVQKHTHSLIWKLKTCPNGVCVCVSWRPCLSPGDCWD